MHVSTAVDERAEGSGYCCSFFSPGLTPTPTPTLSPRPDLSFAMTNPDPDPDPDPNPIPKIWPPYLEWAKEFGVRETAVRVFR